MITVNGIDYLTVPEVAVKLDRHKSVVRRHCANNDFVGAMHCGRDWIVPVAAVEAYKARGPGRPQVLYMRCIGCGKVDPVGHWDRCCSTMKLIPHERNA